MLGGILQTQEFVHKLVYKILGGLLPSPTALCQTRASHLCWSASFSLACAKLKAAALPATLRQIKAEPQLQVTSFVVILLALQIPEVGQQTDLGSKKGLATRSGAAIFL